MEGSRSRSEIHNVSATRKASSGPWGTLLTHTQLLCACQAGGGSSPLLLTRITVSCRSQEYYPPAEKRCDRVKPRATSATFTRSGAGARILATDLAGGGEAHEGPTAPHLPSRRSARRPDAWLAYIHCHFDAKSSCTRHMTRNPCHLDMVSHWEINGVAPGIGMEDGRCEKRRGSLPRYYHAGIQGSPRTIQDGRPSLRLCLHLDASAG